jgi:hypothetical protein
MTKLGSLVNQRVGETVMSGSNDCTSDGPHGARRSGRAACGSCRSRGRTARVHRSLETRRRRRVSTATTDAIGRSRLGQFARVTRSADVDTRRDRRR